MEWKSVESGILVECDCFSPAQTLDCGQAFRWTVADDGTISGIAFGKFLKISVEDTGVLFHNTTEDDFRNIWKDYFDFDRDYLAIQSVVGNHPVIEKAVKAAGGIRILKQDPWETLCSFIISQNNNIPRIKGIISRLCENFGEKIEGGYSFPSAEVLAEQTIESLAPLRCGFRARYILDAAKKVASGEINLELIRTMPTDSARFELMKICGVGEKVADCTLLFGLSHINALPKDVWIKRVLKDWFGGELPEESLPFAGIVQQYLFEYARTTAL